MVASCVIQHVPDWWFHWEDVHYKFDNCIIWLFLKHIWFNGLVLLALGEPCHDTEELPGGFTGNQYFFHGSMFGRVLGEQVQHLSFICIDYAFQNLTAGGKVSRFGEPGISQPAHVFLFESKWVRIPTLLSLYGLLRSHVLVEDWLWSYSLMALDLRDPFTFDVIFYEFFWSFTHELQINNQIWLELNKSVVILLWIILMIKESVALVVHF